MKACVIDIDGTLIDFKKFDNQFISLHFAKHDIIQKLDNLLWKFNSLDIFTNRQSFLKIRLWIYCFLASDIVYSKLLKDYNSCYLTYQEKEFKKVMPLLDVIKNHGYSIYLISNNNICSTIIQSSTSYNCLSPIIFNIKRNKLYKILSEEVNISYVIGNNYMDDILPSKKLKEGRNQELKSIYVGQSKIKHLFKTDFYVSSIDQIKKIVT